MAKTVEWTVESCGTNKDGKPVIGFMSFTIPAAEDELMHPDAPPKKIVKAMAKAAEIMGIRDLVIIDTKTHDSALDEAARVASRPFIS